MVKIRELRMLAGIMYERLRDQKPDEQLLTRCLEPVWPYVYPYGTLSYLKQHSGDSTVEIDRRKTQKMLRALNSSRRMWLSFIIGLYYTYRELHSLQRNRARLAQKAIRLGQAVSVRELDDLAEQFRRSALEYTRIVKGTDPALFDNAEVTEQTRLAKTLLNEENVPRFLRLSRSLDCERILKLASPDLLENIKRRYDKPTALTLAFDLLQEHLALDDSLWKQFKELLASRYH